LSALLIRAAGAADRPAIWAILEPVIRAGESYALPRDMTGAEALAYWHGAAHQVFVAQTGTEILGTYYMRPNQQGGGAHVANCGFMTAPAATGRGIARAMGNHALTQARAAGFIAMQFNFVVSTNTRAIGLWQSLGFATLCRLPQAFAHPAAGLVDALVMHRVL